MFHVCPSIEGEKVLWSLDEIAKGSLRNDLQKIYIVDPPAPRIVSRNLHGISARSANYFECAFPILLARIKIDWATGFREETNEGRRILEYLD